MSETVVKTRIFHGSGCVREEGEGGSPVLKLSNPVGGGGSNTIRTMSLKI